MVPMKALVGFSLVDGSAAASATFNVKDAKAADRLEAAGVAERVRPQPQPAPETHAKKVDATTSAA
ncbi:hypothetical protein [Brevundimonas naejangsanensis]